MATSPEMLAQMRAIADHLESIRFKMMARDLRFAALELERRNAEADTPPPSP